MSTAAFTAVSQLPDEQFLAWGWRLPFIASLVLVMVGLFIRLRVTESPAFAKIREAGDEVRTPIVEVLRRHPRNVFLTAGMRFMDNVLYYYVFATFALTYMTTEPGVPRSVALTAVLIASAIELVTMPYFGALSDRIGRRPVIVGGAVLAALGAYPFFWLVDTEEPVLIVLATIVMIGIAHAAVFAPLAAFFSELFGTGVRYSGVSVGFQLGAFVAGAPTPFVATALLARSDGDPGLIAALVIAAAAVTIFSTYMVSETYRNRMID